MAEHRSDRLKIFGDAPEIERLENDRWRITVRCNVKDKTEDWYKANRDTIFAELGSLYSTEIWGDIEPRDGEDYGDMRLVRHQLAYEPQYSEPLVIFVYETLTDSFVQERDDRIDQQINGLRRVRRTLIAKAGTEYTKTIGTDTIGHSINGEADITLYLGQSEIEDTDSYRRVEEVWFEPGILSQSSRNASEGVKEVTTEFLVVEGTTVGPVTRRTTGNFEGLKTISVTTMQDKSGNSLVVGGENLVHRYQRKVPFEYPGVLSIIQDEIQDGVGTTKFFSYDLQRPTTADVTATVSVLFQTSGDIAASDETYNDGSGAALEYWNPTDWARSRETGIAWNYAPFAQSRAYDRYRINTNLDSVDEITPTGAFTLQVGTATIFNAAGTGTVTKESVTTSGNRSARVSGVAFSPAVLTAYTLFIVNGRRLFSGTPFNIEISGGPDDPSGKKYVLDIDIRPAFEDVDGNIYYKKTIVTATV